MYVFHVSYVLHVALQMHICVMSTQMHVIPHPLIPLL